MGNSVNTTNSNAGVLDSKYEQGYSGLPNVKDFRKNFVNVKTESTPMLGEYTVYEPLNGEYHDLVLAKETKVDNEQQFSRIKNLLIRR